MSKFYLVHGAELLHQKIHFSLSNSPFIRGRDVTFAIDESEVVLSGQVRSYFQKQMAQESLRGIDGVGRIRNDLVVVGA